MRRLSSRLGKGQKGDCQKEREWGRGKPISADDISDALIAQKRLANVIRTFLSSWFSTMIWSR